MGKDPEIYEGARGESCGGEARDEEKGGESEGGEYPCPDSDKAPDEACKHVISTWLVMEASP